MKLTEKTIRSIIEHTARPDVVERLFPVLQGYPYIFIGGFAVSLHTHGRRRVSKNDLDIALKADVLPDVRADIEQTGFTFTRQNRFAGAEWLMFNAGADQQMDIRIIHEDDEFWDHALSSADRVSYHGMTVPLISKPYLLTDKISAGREKDYRDILYLLKDSSPEEIKRAQKLIKTFVPNRIDEFRDLITDSEFGYETINQLYPES